MTILSRHDHHHHDIDDGFFSVHAHDACGAPTIRLGGFTLEMGRPSRSRRPTGRV